MKENSQGIISKKEKNGIGKKKISFFIFFPTPILKQLRRFQTMFLMIDNYDSFTYNLVQYFQALGIEMQVRRNDGITPGEALDSGAEAIVLSPGPGRPENAGILIDLVRMIRQGADMPLLGVCLGHQAIGYAFGAKIIRSPEIMHGKISRVLHDGRGLFRNLPSPFKAVRYHSLAIDENSLPPSELIASARTEEDGTLMGIRHVTRLIEGIQYHPESILTQNGKLQLQNFIDSVRARKTEIQRSNPAPSPAAAADTPDTIHNITKAE